MAFHIEKAFGLKMDTMLRMQTSYEIAEVRKRAAEIKVKRYTGRAKTQRRRAVDGTKITLGA